MRPGEQALYRTVRDGRVRWAIPHTLVDETRERVVWFVRPGVRGRRPTGARGDFARVLSGDWNHREHVWHENRVLRLTPLGAAHSVDLYWNDESSEFLGWYIQLQDPLRRSRFGWDTRDHILDVWIEPDRTWSWKDEDEFAEAQHAGLFDADQAAAIRAEAERVIAHCERWEPPFCDGWETWAPDPGWRLPRLPPGWDRP